MFGECRGSVGAHAADVDLDAGAFETGERASLDLERADDDDRVACDVTLVQASADLGGS